MVSIGNLVIAILFFIGIVIIGYYYYRRSIKVAKQLIKIRIGNKEYKRLKRY